MIRITEIENMIKLLIRWAIVAVALWVAITFVPGISGPKDWPSILGLALIFGLVNALLRPILTLLTCPLIILTLGLGTLLINTLLFWLSGLIGQYFGVGFTVDSFWAAFFGALVVTIVSVVLSVFVPDDREWRWRDNRKYSR
jgi:putative membrane protein